MTNKERILSLLEQKRDVFLSGEELAQRLGLTRAAVWKTVNALKQEGFSIEAIPRRGYRLSIDNDMLSAAGIAKYLDDSASQTAITVYDAVSSTNTVLKEAAARGAAEGTVAIACRQTAGKGRFARHFYSPPDSGIYMSILLRPALTAAQATLITTAAAVAVSDAAERLSGQKTAIKWVNDVLLDGKKICGILTEASLHMENGTLDYAVLGIGLNAYEPDGGFPEEIKNIAGAVFGEHEGDRRNRLAAEVLNRFWHYYRALPEKTFLDAYRSRCFVLGKKILVCRGQDRLAATALAVDDDCRLLVAYENGEQETLSSGEISIRPL